jgi:hypothetical protein
VSGLFTLENNSFPIVGELLCKCLDEIIIDKDYQSAKNCMNFAQTLYKTDSEPNKPRIFLQTYLESHSIWKSIEFWEEFIKCNSFFIFRRYQRRNTSSKKLQSLLF